MSNPSKRVTKADVAQFAQVSHMTVTRALTGSGSIKEETRQKVLTACKQLGYTPDLVARTLCARRSRILGLISPNLAQGYFARITSSVECRASALGYQILMAQYWGDDGAVLGSLQSLFGRRVDGLLVTGMSLPPDAAACLTRSGVPAVFMDAPGPGGNSVFVGIDDVSGAREAVSHLVALGHRKIACLAGPPDSYTSQKRIEGYASALADAGIPFDGGDVYHTNYQLDGGYRAAEAMLSSGRGYTAALCGNDYVAVGAIARVRARGLSVPKDISLIGFSGDELGEYSVPPLTTMYQPAEEIGSTAVDLAMELIEGAQAPRETLLTASLVVRESTAPPRN